MSGGFYFTLNSEGSKNIHANNHGGDFTVQLHNTLDLPGAWEVALIEMSYIGQFFGNILYDYGNITVSSDKDKAYPIKFVVDYDVAKEMYISIDMWGHIYSREILRFEKSRQYTWKAVKKAFKNLKPSTSDPALSFQIIKNKLLITPINVNLTWDARFSPFLVKLLSLKSPNAAYHKSQGHKITEMDIEKPDDIRDDSPVLFTPDTIGEIWIRINNSFQINISKTYCTVNLFNKAASNKLFAFTIVKVSTDTDEWQMSMKYSGDKNYNADVVFSDAIQAAPNVPVDTFFYCGKQASSTLTVKPKRAPESVNSFNEINLKLSYNYYPNAQSLVENLNMQVVETMYKIAALQHSEQDFENIFCYHEVGSLVLYKSIFQFNVTLSTYTLKMLNLAHTNYTNNGTAAIKLPPAVRPFLHVYCNIIMPQPINDDEYPLLRVINNNAIENEKAMLTFSQPQYYPVSRRYITSIHSYITDHVHPDPLIFTHPISFLLHFRPTQ